MSLPHFLHDIWRKIFILLYCNNWPIFSVCLSLLHEILGNMCIVIICQPGLIKSFFLHDEKVKTKIYLNYLSWERKEPFRWKKAFSIVFEGLSLKQIIKNLEGESSTFRCTLRSETMFGGLKPLKNDEKCFLFHLKSSFRSQDIKLSSWLFGYVAKRFD